MNTKVSAGTSATMVWFREQPTYGPPTMHTLSRDVPLCSDHPSARHSHVPPPPPCSSYMQVTRATMCAPACVMATTLLIWPCTCSPRLYVLRLCCQLFVALLRLISPPPLVCHVLLVAVALLQLHLLTAVASVSLCLYLCLSVSVSLSVCMSLCLSLSLSSCCCTAVGVPTRQARQP
jgi:hypothetical protein